MIVKGLGANVAPLKPALIFGWFGDSLAKGSGDNPYPVAQRDHRFLKVDAAKVQQAIDPMNDTDFGAMFSGSHPLGVRMRELAPTRTIIVCNSGRAGSRSDDWLPGMEKYDDFANLIRRALAFTDAKIGLLYAMLGQNNATSDAGIAAFPGNMPDIFDGLRADFAGQFHDANHCVGMSQMCSSLPGPPWEAWDYGWNQIRADIASFAVSMPELLIVENPNGPWVDGNPGLHPQTSCYQLLGATVAEQWSALVTL